MEENSGQQPKPNAVRFDNGNCVYAGETRCRILFENSFDAALLTMPDGKIVAANPKACLMFGMTEDELKAMDREGILLSGEKSTAAFKEQEGTGQAMAELTFKRKDGTIFEGEVSSRLFTDCDGVTKASMLIRNIDQRKKDEQSLKESEEKYRSLFRNMLNGFAYCKIITGEKDELIDFVYLEVNDAFEKLTGLKKADVTGKNATDAIPGIREAHPELFEIYSRVALTGKTEHFETHFEPLDIWLSISVYSPKKGYFAAVFENITEQKQAEKKLEEYSEGLELTVAARTQELTDTNARLLKTERFAAIGELAGMIGHDLRNPLTGIKGSAYYLRGHYFEQMDETGKDMLKTIDDCVEYSNKIINDLLEYSREIKLELTESTPKMLLANTLSMLKVPSSIKLVDGTEDNPVFLVDQAKMSRVFTNLITNAFDAMPNGGSLTVLSRNVGGMVEITFSDSGMGMSAETLSKLWLPLFTTKAKGMGFGLSICRRMVEAHGGKISVKSVEEKGTSFKIMLPSLP